MLLGADPTEEWVADAWAAMPAAPSEGLPYREIGYTAKECERVMRKMTNGKRGCANPDHHLVSDPTIHMLPAAPEFYEDGQRIMPDDKPAAPAEGLDVERLTRALESHVCQRPDWDDGNCDPACAAAIAREYAAAPAEGTDALPVDLSDYMAGYRQAQADLTGLDAAPAEGLREAASAIAQPPGAAEMARWMEAWDREPPTLRVPPVVTVKFSRDATPEEVDTVREQIESMFPDLARLRRIEAAASAIALDYHSNAITCDDSHPSVTWGRCTDPKCDALRAALTPEADR